MIKYFIYYILMFSTLAFSQNAWYFNRTFGHIHQKPYSNSMSVTGLSCGEKLQKNNKEKISEQDWIPVEFGDKQGFVYK